MMPSAEVGIKLRTYQYYNAILAMCACVQLRRSLQSMHGGLRGIYGARPPCRAAADEIRSELSVLEQN